MKQDVAKGVLVANFINCELYWLKNCNQSKLFKTIHTLLFLFVSSVYSYNIRISPRIKTSVTSLKNQGDNNSIHYSSISNSTILQAIPQQLYDSHYNELLSTSVILTIFALVFIILSVIINKLTLALFKLSQRVNQLETRYSS